MRTGWPKRDSHPLDRESKNVQNKTSQQNELKNCFAKCFSASKLRLSNVNLLCVKMETKIT